MPCHDFSAASLPSLAAPRCATRQARRERAVHWVFPAGERVRGRPVCGKRERSRVTAQQPRFDPDSAINYYQVLNVPYGASKEEIARAYRQLMRLTHPDHVSDPDERGKAEERAKLLNVAYGVLSRPESRRAYDAVMRQTVMSDALMQRYTGNAPGRPSPFREPPRPPSARVVRARKAAYTSAVRQLLVVTAGFVLALIVVALLLALAGNLA